MQNIISNINNLINEVNYYSSKKSADKDLKETEAVRNDIREAWFKHHNNLGTLIGIKDVVNDE